MRHGFAKPTQRDVARLAGVSQATVSLVLNGRAEGDARIGAETRERVVRLIRETGYVADPIARRLAQKRNRILGVFTYEPAFPSADADFYTPFLYGIEAGAEALGYDLLLFTGAQPEGGTRRIFHANHRLRLADGCLLLGRGIDRDELARLVRERYPFVAVGRRDDAGGPVAYVGADYVAATAALVARAAALGHARVAYCGAGAGAESSADRLSGFHEGLRAARLEARCERIEGRPGAEILDALLAEGVTAAFVEDTADAVLLVEAMRERGLSAPAHLSVATLGNPTRPVASDMAFSGFRIPRENMGRQAAEALVSILEGGPGERQRRLPCEPVAGRTLGPAPAVKPARAGRRKESVS